MSASENMRGSKFPSIWGFSKGNARSFSASLKWEMPHFSEAEKDRAFPLLKPQMEGNFDPRMFSDADMIVVGDPDTCYEKMVKYAELGVDQLICYVQFGYLSHDSVVRTIELLGEKIIPEIEKVGAKVGVTTPAGPATEPAVKAEGQID